MSIVNLRYKKRISKRAEIKKSIHPINIYTAKWKIEK